MGNGIINTVEDDIFTTSAMIMVHQVNCRGAMGSGMAKQIKLAYPSVFSAYKARCKSAGGDPSQLLGTCLIVPTGQEHGPKYVANLFAQDEWGYTKRYTDYEAFSNALDDLYDQADLKFDTPPTFAIPYGIGCGTGGGTWATISKYLEEFARKVSLDRKGSVTVYKMRT